MVRTKSTGNSPAFENKNTNKYRKRRRKPALNKQQASAVKAIIAAQDAKEVELKHYDVDLNYSITNDFTSTNTHILSYVAQGDGSSLRDGDALKPKSLFLRFELRVPDANNRVRVIIWRQMEDTSVVSPAMSKLLEYSSSAAVDRHIYSPYKVHSTDLHFKVLFDKNYYLSSGINTEQVIEEIYLDLSNSPQIHFQDGVQDGKNHYMLSFVSDSVTTPPTMAGWSRLRYTDQ